MLLSILLIICVVFFLVSEHNLTRKTTLLNLRYMFNGDIAINNLNNLYSKDTTKIKISHPYNEKYEEIPYDNYKTYINTAY